MRNLPFGLDLVRRSPDLLAAAGLLACSVALPNHVMASEADCEGWGDEAFFREADFATAVACLDAEAPVDIRAPDGETPLHWAAAYAEDPRIIARLISFGADPNSRRADGYTPLHMAAEQSVQPSVIVNLALNGADPGSIIERDGGFWATKGTTALHLAARRGDVATMVAALLLSGSKVDTPDQDGRNALHEVARSPTGLATVEILMLEDPDAANRRDESGGWTPLHIAATHNPAAAIVATMVRHGADPKKTNDDDRTPLHMAAAYNQSPAVLEVLLDATDEPCAKDKDDASALEYAVGNDAIKNTPVYWRIHELCYTR